MFKNRVLITLAGVLCVCLLTGICLTGCSNPENAVSSVTESEVSDVEWIDPSTVPDAPDRELIDPSEKVLLSDEWTLLSSRIAPPSLECYAAFTVPRDDPQEPDPYLYVIQGKIVSEADLTSPILDNPKQNEVLKEKYGGSGLQNETWYTVDLEQVWYGDIPESQRQIDLWIGGGKDSLITKPDVGEEVVLFLYVQNGEYTALDLEHGIFTVNDDGTLYSFSNLERFCKYDGQPVQMLIDDLYQAIEEAQKFDDFNQAISASREKYRNSSD